MGDLEGLSEWLADNWDPNLTFGDWWQRLADGRYAVPTWPSEFHGRGWRADDARQLNIQLRRAGIPGPPSGLGIMLAGPTLLRHGTEEQKHRLLPDIVNGQANWCQLFSEPGAGSDLASLRTRAERVGSIWRITGQKVWTSNGHLADWGMLLARTDPTSSGRDGISWMAIRMDQPGIEVRPLREMTGRSLFTEVFFDEAIVEEGDVVGEVSNGWAVARTTLASEREGLSAGAAVGASPGRKAGIIYDHVGNAAQRRDQTRSVSGTSLAMRGRAYPVLREAALSKALHPADRETLVRVHEIETIADLMQHRARASTEGQLARSYASLGKLLHSQGVRLARQAAMGILNADGLVASDGSPTADALRELVQFSPAVSIYGGSDEIQRNMIAERGLGLPSEANVNRTASLQA